MPENPRTRTLSAIVALALLCTLLVLPTASAAGGKANGSAGAKDFTILHTNDEHSEIIPYDVASDYPGNPTTGGFSRIAKSIADIKAAKAAQGEPVVTVGAGDWSQGTLFAWLGATKAPELTLFQRMGYDAIAIGNHNVELGPAYLATELAAARANGVNLPILSSNIKFSGYPPDPASADYGLYSFWSATDRQRSDLYIQPYTVKTLSNGLKVGLFSLMGVEAETVAPAEAPLSFGNVPGDTTASFINRVNTATDMVKTLRETKGCQVVVCVSHMGTSEEKKLATYVQGIDVIIGGHSHELIYPPMIEGPGNTIIVQADAYTEYLGDLELRYDPSAETRVTVRETTRVVHMDQTVGTSPAVDAVIDGFLGAINDKLGFNCLDRLAETDVNGDGGFDLLDRPPFTETNVGDLVTDAYLAKANQADPAHPSNFAIEGNGVVRAGIPKGASGAFSFYDLYRVLPLGGSPYELTTPGYPLVSFYLRGGEIRAVMEQLLALRINDLFVQMSGLKLTYDPNAETGKKIKDIRVRQTNGKYEELKADGTLYKLVTAYYTGSFLSMFGLFPRDATGAQHKPPAHPDPMKDFIIHTGSSELKSWQAVARQVGGYPDLDGDKLPNIPNDYYTRGDRINELATTFYFAEGTTRPNFETYFCIQNPGGREANVELTYMKGDGKSEKQNMPVPARSRRTVRPADILGVGDDPSHDFATKVVSLNGEEIFVERPMYFNYGGEWTGGHAVMGSTSLGQTFYFAEGTVRPEFETYFCIQNPNDEDAYLRLAYSKGDGATEEHLLLIPKNSRYTERVKATLGESDGPAADFSCRIECFNEQNILVERPMYFNYKGRWTGGSDVVGAAGPNTCYYFAEGTCRPGFEPYFCIQNTTSADATVEITYMKGDDTTGMQTLVVPKSSRATVVVKDELGEGDDAAHDFSAKVESANKVPIVVERPMYFNFMQEWNGGHDVLGENYQARTFHFAEGTCRPGFEAYLSVQNPGAHDARVKVTYMLGAGGAKEQVIVVPAGARATVHPADVIGVAHAESSDFSAKVECANGYTIIAERPMYFNFQGWTGGSCVPGY